MLKVIKIRREDLKTQNLLNQSYLKDLIEESHLQYKTHDVLIAGLIEVIKEDLKKLINEVEVKRNER